MGLVATNWTERDELVDIVQRFGRLAAISVSVIIGTGLIQAFRLVGSPTNLFDADHGVYLVVKILFLGVMLKVADINRQRVGRRFRDPATATPRITGILRRAMGTELAVGAVVIGITAAMVVSPPAVAQQRDTATAAAVPEAGSVELASVPALVPVQLTTPSLPDTVPTPQESSCVIEPVVLAMGSVGDSVVCLQRTLIVLGVYAAEPTGEFDSATDQAVRVLQQQLGLAVDGIVGQITASSIGIWPGL